MFSLDSNLFWAIVSLLFLILVIIGIVLTRILVNQDLQRDQQLAKQRKAQGYKDSDFIDELERLGVPTDVGKQTLLLLRNGGYWVDDFPFLPQDYIYRRSEEKDIDNDAWELAERCHRRKPSTREIDTAQIKTAADLALFISKLPPVTEEN